jgi:hypothetical protein
MTTFEIIQIFIGSGGLLGIIFIFFKMGKFAQKIETLDESCKKNFTEIRNDIKEIKHSINALEIQMGKLETRVEERTLRTVQTNYAREPAVR